MQVDIKNGKVEILNGKVDMRHTEYNYDVNITHTGPGSSGNRQVVLRDGYNGSSLDVLDGNPGGQLTYTGKLDDVGKTHSQVGAHLWLSQTSLGQSLDDWSCSGDLVNGGRGVGAGIFRNQIYLTVSKDGAVVNCTLEWDDD